MITAGITGTLAMPRALRHGFGVNAFQSNLLPHLLQRWLSHALLNTAGIYGDGSLGRRARVADTHGNSTASLDREKIILVESFEFLHMR